ncbi:MAG: prepilin-type N-terminal cleavage/methylation domain-containing protein [Clostridium sp.]|nr:prepilin-type N-terminal cleavage/methylation domain-containing protein [Clostridium sp.]
MFKLIQKAKRNEKGFTLVELMVVVIIIGVLVAIAVPIFGTVTRNAANQAHQANIRTLAGAASMHIAAAGRPAAELILTGSAWDPANPPSPTNNPLMQYLQSWPTVPADAHGPLPTGFPVAIDGAGEANSANANGTYTVVIAPTGAISIRIAD